MRPGHPIFPFARFRVEEESMRPFLSPGDYVFVNRWAYLLHGPRVGDIVVLRSPEGQGLPLIKRVARVIDSERIFVVGDDLECSRDSRHFGPVDLEHVIGRVCTVVRP